VNSKRGLDKLREDIELVYDQETVRQTMGFLETLKKKAEVSYVPRELFVAIAENRKRCKTPPGFKDPGDGDFFIWADFLAGLVEARQSGAAFSKSVLVTLEKKPDWSRDSVAHPILSAEAVAAAEAPFELWSLDRLAREVDEAT
jgi:hypothetical protein